MNIFKAIFFGLILTSSQISVSAEVTPEAIPKNLHVYAESGSTFVDHIATGCSGKRYYLPDAHKKYNTIVSILMAAQMGGKSVQLRFDGCNSEGQGIIVGAYLK